MMRLDQQRAELAATRLVATGGERAQRIAVVALPPGDDVSALRLANLDEILPRHLQCRFDRFRSAVVCEPRGSDVIVGALLVEPTDPTCAAGVLFFNNVGYLGMCGHGTIGLIATLAYLGRIAPISASMWSRYL